jgi:hypothetical protein
MGMLLRWVLPVLLGANGLFMLIAPDQWYPVVPGVTDTGPFNVHFIRDIGAAYIACALGMGWWAARRPGGSAALVPVAAFLGLHMLVHFFEAMTGHHPSGDIIRDFVGVYVPALIAIWLAWRGVKAGEA